VRVVLFTDVWLSPISRQASHVLVSRTVSSSPFYSFAPMFALVETIVAAVAARLGDDAQRRVAQTEALLGGWTWEPEA
jgi:DNA-binding MurR/RpiR family transcriptional regulator